jgi:outer membrane immunogenic protein
MEPLANYEVFTPSSAAIFSPCLDHVLSEEIRLGGGERLTGLCEFGTVSGARQCREILEVDMTLRAFVGGCALAAGTVACVCSAQAADLPAPPAPAPVAPVAYAPPVYNWSGFYVGGHIGGGFANSSWGDPFNGATNTFSDDGFLGGAQIGANAQFNWLVVGLEGDFSWTGLLKGSGTDSAGDTIRTNPQWTSTITGRIGAAFDRLLVYGKGGLALADDQSSLTDPAGNVSNDTLTRTGWTAGAGLEYALDQNWTARIEYDYLGFGSQSLNFTTPVIGAVSPSANLNIQEVKAGLNFKFGGP